ncbi:hypothetical protein C8R46DRAFT_1235892 [Mycena filopes]|nr:hypothetical protein C8R46DRAFT_1235892 [Mycena filopes]
MESTFSTSSLGPTKASECTHTAHHGQLASTPYVPLRAHSYSCPHRTGSRKLPDSQIRLGRPSLPVQLDITDQASIENAPLPGGLDVLINNAAVWLHGTAALPSALTLTLALACALRPSSPRPQHLISSGLWIGSLHWHRHTQRLPQQCSVVWAIEEQKGKRSGVRVRLVSMSIYPGPHMSSGFL